MTIRALVSCHCSVTLVDELRALGVAAYSCDLKPAERDTAYHIVADVREVIADPWDLLIGSPVCTRMANSGSKWLYIGGQKVNGRDESRWSLCAEDAEFFRLHDRAEHIPHRAIENSVMHRHAREMVQHRQTQVVQPWWFGEPFFKATALWLTRLPALVPTDRLTPPRPGTDEHKEWSAVFRAPPGPNRAADRARSFPGMMRAWATQWVGAIEESRHPLPLFERLAA